MDIFIGSNFKIQGNFIKRVNGIIDTLGHDFEYINKGSYYLWKNIRNEGESLVYADDKFEIIFDGYLNNITGALVNFLPVLARRIIQEGLILKGEETGIFNIAILDKVSQKIFLASDPGALFPLYYILKDEQFYFFSHMYIFAEALNQRPDPVGIITKLKFGYTFGSRTLYESISRLNPGEIIIFDNSNGTVLTQLSENYYSHYEEFGRELKEATWNCLQQPFRALPKHINKLGVMLSEGFDSRLVAGLAANSGINLSTFTHGTPGTKGANITFAVAEFLSTEFFFDPLNKGLPTEEDSIMRQLYLSDNLSIPYWINSSKYFGNSNVDSVTAGTALDSTLGGHPFFRPTRPRNQAVFQRYYEIINQDLGLLDDNYIEGLSYELLDNFRSASISSNIIPAISDNLNIDLMEYLSQFLGGVIEDFDIEKARVSKFTKHVPSLTLVKLFMENRARKYSFGQELTLRINNRLIVPTYEPITMRLLSSIHPRYKIQHKLYLSLINTYLPRLFAIPNGGYGLPAYFPRFILESFRFMHKYYENRFVKQYIKQRGNVNIGNLRSVNFIESTYRKGESIDFFITYFNNSKSIFNSERLIAKLQNIKDYQSKSFQVMDSYRLFELALPLQKF